MKKNIVAVAALIVLLVAASAKAAEVISGQTILDNSIEATDLGTDVTRVKATSVTVLPSENEWTCPDEDAGNYNTCYQPNPGPGSQHFTVRCASGNVASGGVRLVNIDQGFNLAVYGSYPASDSAWAFDLYNTGPDNIAVQLRVICI